MKTAFAVTLVLALASSALAEPKPGEPAPALGAFEQAQGEPVRDLGSLRGNVVLLEFFATW